MSIKEAQILTLTEILGNRFQNKYSDLTWKGLYDYYVYVTSIYQSMDGKKVIRFWTH